VVALQGGGVPDGWSARSARSRRYFMMGVIMPKAGWGKGMR